MSDHNLTPAGGFFVVCPDCQSHRYADGEDVNRHGVRYTRYVCECTDPAAVLASVDVLVEWNETTETRPDHTGRDALYVVSWEETDDDDPAHVDYPHDPGYLHDCPACESRCHCAGTGNAPCVWSGHPVIREVIHHGEYRSTVDHVAHDLSDDALAAVLVASEYGYRRPSPVALADMRAALADGGTWRGVGWSSWSVVTD